MNRTQPLLTKATILLSLLLCCLLVAQAGAMGGKGGGDNEAPPDNTKKLKMNPLDDQSNAYGWVRITADALTLGANRLQPDSYYTVYFVNGSEKQAIGEEPTIQTSGVGEAKFQTRLTEPLGAKWSKIVMYAHTDNQPQPGDNLKPVMEASLR